MSIKKNSVYRGADDIRFVAHDQIKILRENFRDRHWYRWIILFASFSCRFLTFGTVFSVFGSKL